MLININKSKKGFTLIELLIVIAIIAILMSVIFVALDPLRRFRDSRDSARWQDVSAIVNAIKIDQVDNGGFYINTISSLVEGEVYMINDGSETTGCDDYNTDCDVDVDGDTHCVNLSGLIGEGYLGAVPISSDGVGTWTAGYSGYTLMASSTGVMVIQACESENSTDIKIIR